jgi:hypothetical protein
MKLIIAVLCLLCSSQIVAQDTLHFYSVYQYGTCDNEQLINSLTRIDSLNNPDYFFTNDYDDYYGFYFFHYNNSVWDVFEFKSSEELGNTASIHSIKKIGQNLLAIQVYYAPSGGQINRYGYLLLINIKHNTLARFLNFYSSETYYNLELTERQECQSDYKVVGNKLTVTTITADESLYCIKSGEYILK